MLFNSYIFIFIYLPITLIGYFLLNRKKYVIASKVWLSLASVLFYAYWNMDYLPLLLGSIFFNYGIGAILSEGKIKSQQTRKRVLAFGIACNIGLICYYKYLNFFIANISSISQLDIRTVNLILPLGISFFTFTQIAFLVDTYHKKSYELNFMNYILFVTFFPHLIAGPIIHHKEMMPQFESLRNKFVNWTNVYRGLFLFIIGLFKKIVLADTLSHISNTGFDRATSLNFVEAWVTSLSYTFQLYFDFSGYTDMALGLSLMFNIILPINFNSPYKARDISDFWKRWHITLSRFLKDYIYIPLGGSQKGELLTHRNLIITFFICGFWHGAGWNFILWGVLNGLAVMLHRIWHKKGFKMHNVLAWLITFNFVNICWIFFRARNWGDAVKVIKGMVNVRDVHLPQLPQGSLQNLKDIGVSFANMNWNIPSLSYGAIVLLLICFATGLLFRNSNQLANRISANYTITIGLAFIFLWVVFLLGKPSEFLYFNF